MSWVILGMHYFIEVVCCTVALYLLCLWIFARRKGKGYVREHRYFAAEYFLVIYLSVVAVVTGIADFRTYGLPHGGVGFYLRLFQGQSAETMGLNLLLFVPLGILGPAVIVRMRSCKKVLLTGFCFSLGIELIQTFFAGRIGDVNDLLMNTTGAMVGFAVYLACARLMGRWGKVDAIYIKTFLAVVFSLVWAVPIQGVCVGDILAWQIGIPTSYIGSGMIKLFGTGIAAVYLLIVWRRRAASHG